MACKSPILSVRPVMVSAYYSICQGMMRLAGEGDAVLRGTALSPLPSCFELLVKTSPSYHLPSQNWMVNGVSTPNMLGTQIGSCFSSNFGWGSIWQHYRQGCCWQKLFHSDRRECLIICSRNHSSLVKCEVRGSRSGGGGEEFRNVP